MNYFLMENDQIMQTGVVNVEKLTDDSKASTTQPTAPSNEEKDEGKVSEKTGCSCACQCEHASTKAPRLSDASIIASIAPGELPIDLDIAAVEYDETICPEEDWDAKVGNDAICTICLQSMGPFLLAGLGSIGSGVLSEGALKKIPIINKMHEFLAVTPPLCGLKGNLDSTFSSRLSTMAQDGQLTPFKRGRSQVLRHMAMIQFQSIILAVVACGIAFFYNLSQSLLEGRKINTDHYLYMASAAVFAMPINCAFSMCLLTSLIVFAHRWGFNPDNLATPLANSIGDLMTIGLVVSGQYALGFCYLLYDINNLNNWMPFLITSAALLLSPAWLYFTRNDLDLLHMEKWQWSVLVPAIILSGGSGFLQHWTSEKFSNFPLFLPLITGIAGNRVAVQSSRISTVLNLNKKSIIPFSIRLNPYKYYFSRANESAAARLLAFTSVPFQLMFVGMTYLMTTMASMEVKVQGWFIFGYLIIAFIQVTLMLWIAQLVVYFLWSRGWNPDSYAIPLLTATTDLTGSSLLTALFHILRLIGGNNGHVS